MRKFILDIVAFAFLCSTSLNAQFEGYNHPELEWKTFETEHFFIHFHQGEERTPFLVAKIAEELYEPVTSMYNFEPDSKIHFIIKDTDDYSNGIAYYYDNKVVIYATPFDFVLRGTMNWLRNVVAHEFTHMIQLQASRKITRRIPALYVQVISYEEEKRNDVLYGFPNVISSYPIAGTVIPVWFAEGTAQYGALMNGYDYWDSHRDMILRMRALDNDLLSLKEMGVFGKGSLGNESAYNQGFSLVYYIAKTYGEETLSRISHEMAKLPVMSTKKPIRNVLGIDEKEVYGGWKEKITADYLKSIEIIRENLVKGTIIEEKGISNIFPKWSPDNETYTFVSNKKGDYITDTHLYLRKGESLKLIRGGVFSNPSWSSDGKTLFYSRLKKDKNDSFFLDIFSYDVERGKETRITKGARANYPSVSPDNEKIVCTIGTDGTYNLAVVDIQSKKINYITRFNDGEEIFTPVWSHDGKKIVFAIGKDVGRDIALINSDGTGLEYLLKGKEDERDPVFGPDGNFIYFSSDKTGIFNIYRIDPKTKKTEMVTNVVSGAFMPSVNKKGELLFTLYKKDGYKIALLEKPVAVDPAAGEYKNMAEHIPELDYDGTVTNTYKPEKYKSLYSKTFLLPRLFFDYGKPKLGFYSYVNDVLDKHNFFFGAAINKDLDYDLFGIFEYRTRKPTLFLELYNLRRKAYFYDELYKYEHDVRFSLLEADLGFSMKLNELFDLRCALIYARMIANDKTSVENGPLLRPFRYNYYKGKDFSFRLTHRNILRTLDSEINPSKGRHVIFEYHREYNRFLRDFEYGEVITEVFDPYNYNRLMLKWREYLKTPVGVFSYYLNSGYIDKPVDDFFHLFAGGLQGLKGYSYYSIGGTKMFVNTATYRFPIKRKINASFGPWYFDKMYGAVSFQYGNSWSDNKIDFDEFKKVIDLELRIDAFSFYMYPTKIAFSAAYGFNEVTFEDYTDGKKWRFFLQVLFDYDLY